MSPKSAPSQPLPKSVPTTVSVPQLQAQQKQEHPFPPLPPGLSQKETPPVPFTQLRPVALLSFFDGIGVAAQALKSLRVEPALYFSFETDVACQRCCTSQHSSVEHQGDALAVDPSRLASTLQTRCPSDTVLLVCAAPPCHDFSAIRGASSPGVAGPEGAKFVSWSSGCSSSRLCALCSWSWSSRTS